MDTKDSLVRKLDHLPSTPGCYLFKNSDGKVLYIGKAKVLRSRVRQYFHASRADDPKLRSLTSKICDVEVIETDSEVEALILESNLVKSHKPRYNIELKDDKSFPYIKVTQELFPRIFVTREKEHHGGRFFGPYTDVKTLRNTLKTLHRIFPIRSCTHTFNEEMIRSKKVKLCLDFYIKKCEGPCQGLVAPDDYKRLVDQMARFLEGKTKELLVQLRREMQTCVDQMAFEEAAKLRDRIQAIENHGAQQKVVFEDEADRDILAAASEDDQACGVVFKVRDGKLIGRQHYYFSHTSGKTAEAILSVLIQSHYCNVDTVPQEIYLPCELSEAGILRQWLLPKAERGLKWVVPKIGDKHKLVEMAERNATLLLGELKLQKLKAKEQFVPKILLSLQRDLSLSNLPRRIECFDNSNIQGSDPVSSLVVFVDGRAKKSDYRRFKVKTVEGADDFATMFEVVTRRYLRLLSEGIDFPDLIVVDGGKGQLSSAVGALEALGVEVSKAGSPGQAVIGLAKKMEEIFVPGVGDAIMIPKTSSSIKLLQTIRDEAHRFALAFHRERREKRVLHSSLDDIPGIGEKRRIALLNHFGSVQAVQQANLESLIAVDGIPEEIARRIHEYFLEASAEEEIWSQ